MNRRGPLLGRLLLWLAAGYLYYYSQVQTFRPTLFVLLVLVASCGPNGCDDYAGWKVYENEDASFAIRYMAPPWTFCSDTEFADDCYECPVDHLSNRVSGRGTRWMSMWVEPVLLDPDFLLIPSYKLEISWFNGDETAMELARSEQRAMNRAGLEIVREAVEITLHDGTPAAMVRYRGPVHLVVGANPINRPDEREYRVVYVVDERSYRIAIDSAIDDNSPEVASMVESFTILEEAE